MSSRFSRLSARCLVLWLASAVAADARAERPPGLYLNVPLTSQGATRLYDVLVPASYDGTADVPLVIDLHGFGRTSAFQRSMSGFAAVAESEGFIVAWPQGIDTTWNAGSPCTSQGTVDDVGFMRAVVAAIGADNRVDQVRIYATGESCGAAMTHRLACEAADLFAAAAQFSWPVPLVSCAPSRPISVLETHSFDDTRILYPGGPINNDPNNPVLPGSREGFEDWRLRDGCTGSSPDITENPGPTSVCERYTTCNGGVQVGLCSVHTDPAILQGHYPYLPLVLDGFNSQQWAWDFLSNFTLPDADQDGIPDASDDCPSVANHDQADADSDLAGDACDNCRNVANPRVAPDFLTANPWATLTGGQRDDDRDGYGNKCDGKFPGVAGLFVGNGDLAEWRASNTKNRTLDQCGTAGNRPCAIYDLDEAGLFIGNGDLAQWRLLNTKQPGPKCPTCPLACTSGTSGDCP